MADFYRLSDDSYWDIKKACFVDSVPENADWVWPLTDDWESRDIEGLRKCLRYFNQPLGVLKEDSDLAEEIRNERNRKLTETDYLAMYDYPIGDKKEAILNYRQALRDITKQEGFPKNVIWPEKTWE